jgi:hypothetical protein
MSILRNPALLLTIAIPSAAVIASFYTLGLAIQKPEYELPEQYNWEGKRLDRDFELARQAQALDVRGTLHVPSVAGTCAIDLELAAERPEALDLFLVHGTRPALDLRTQLRHVSGSRYEGPCHGAADGSWRMGLADAANSWSLRLWLDGSLASVPFSAAVQEES